MEIYNLVNRPVVSDKPRVKATKANSWGCATWIFACASPNPNVARYLDALRVYGRLMLLGGIRSRSGLIVLLYPNVASHLDALRVSQI